MSNNVYDHWERLVASVIRREQLWQMFHDRSPSISSESSDFSLDSPLPDVPLGSSSPRGSSQYQQQHTPKGRNSQMTEKSVEKEVSGLVFIRDFNPAFDLQDMFSSAKFLGKGTFGSAYVAAMDSGTTVVLKRLKVAYMPETEFRKHMEITGNVRHENVAAMRAYYYSNDEKLMVYDHYSKGSLSAMVHGKLGQNRVHLDWETRLRIAVGAARGIAHIHTQNGGKLFHGNIRSSNIFLNSQQYGFVSDLGIANMIKRPLMRTAGYHAPEVKSTLEVSQASDIYSFGILMIEVVTGVSPLHAKGGNHSVELIKLFIFSKLPYMFGGELLSDPDQKMLEIGMRCVAKTPRKRPKMAEVLRMLEDIGKLKIS